MTNKKEILRELIEEANQNFDLKEYSRLTKEYNKIKEEMEDQNLNLENKTEIVKEFLNYTQERLEEDYLEVVDEYKDLYLQYQFERMNY